MNPQVYLMDSNPTPRVIVSGLMKYFYAQDRKSQF
jgi:hypothetical protein